MKYAEGKKTMKMVSNKITKMTVDFLSFTLRPEKGNKTRFGFCSNWC